MKRMYAYYFHGKDGNDHGERLLKEISGYISIKEYLSYLILNFHGRGYPYVGDMDMLYEARENGNKPYVWVFYVEDGHWEYPLENIKELISILQKDYLDPELANGLDLGLFYEGYLYLSDIVNGIKTV